VIWKPIPLMLICAQAAQPATKSALLMQSLAPQGSLTS